MHGPIPLVTRQPLGQVQPFVLGVGNCLRWSYPGGRERGESKNHVLLGTNCFWMVCLIKFLRTSIKLVQSLYSPSPALYSW